MINIETLKLLKNSRQDSYKELKGLFLYHTNKIEGSTFTQLQISLLINEGIVQGQHNIDDIMETNNSIELFDLIVDGLGKDKITKIYLRQMHNILKAKTSDEDRGFSGKFKPIPNMISGSKVKLAQPYEVEEKLEGLLSRKIKSIEDIAIFHKDFEMIHPFTDGNGRIGRMLVFKQCFENDIVPPLILDEHSLEYKKALAESQLTDDNSFIIESFKEGQEEIKNTDIYAFLKEIEKIDIKDKSDV